MKTVVLLAGPAAIAAAVEALRSGEVVGLPTETVYGLAADALNPDAVIKIFEAKERPAFNPLIVHLPDRSWLERLALIPTSERELVETIAGAFWPGPLTMVLPRTEEVPDIVAAGLATVAVRVSAHPVLRDVLQALGRPLAAPSANRFGRISPTAAAHVRDELDGRIPLIIDGGATSHGIESTIVAVRNSRIELLRRGPVTAEQLREFDEVLELGHRSIEAPGQLPSHYAPRSRLVLVDEASAFRGDRSRAGLLAWRSVPAGEKFAAALVLSANGDLREAATNLFRSMRELDALQLEMIVAEAVPGEGIAEAIMDRLRRAAS